MRRRREFAVGQQRLLEPEIEMHRPGAPAAAAEGGGDSPGELRRLGDGEITVRPDGAAEQRRLQLGGLVGPGAAQRLRPVGGHRHERHSGVVRLQDRRVQVRRRGARRGDHGGGMPGPAHAERGEGGHAFVVPDPQPQRTVAGARWLTRGG